MATPSVAMIPTGFKEGKLYSVLPEDGSGDFEFTRASAATRVNEDGLIQTESIDSSELILNGTFQNDDDWVNEQNTWTLGNGRAIGNGANGGAEELQQSVLTIGKTYKYSFEVENYVSGAIVLFGTGTAILANGVYEGRYTAFTDKVSFRGVNFFGDITNVDVFESEVDDIPRLDYTDGGCPVLLTEPQSTNEIEYSEDFSNAYWTKNGASVVGGFQSPSADSPLNAFKLVENASSGEHQVFRTPVAGNDDYSISVFAKKGERTKIRVNIGNDSHYVDFDLELGVVIATVGATTVGKIEALKNDWYRCSLSYTESNGSPIYNLIRLLDATGNSSYTGDGTSGVYIFGAQLEELPYASSYIPTDGGTVTRAAESCFGSGNASDFNSSEGVFFAEISALDNDLTDEVALSVSQGQSGVNRLLIRFKTNGTIGTVLRVDNTTEASIDSGVLDQSENHKVAVKWKLNDVALWINGVEVGADNSANVFSANTLDEISFNQGNGFNRFYGKTSQVQVFKTALSDSELQTLTTL